MLFISLSLSRSPTIPPSLSPNPRERRPTGRQTAVNSVLCARHPEIFDFRSHSPCAARPSLPSSALLTISLVRRCRTRPLFFLFFVALNHSSSVRSVLSLRCISRYPTGASLQQTPPLPPPVSLSSACVPSPTTADQHTAFFTSAHTDTQPMYALQCPCPLPRYR